MYAQQIALPKVDRSEAQQSQHWQRGLQEVSENIQAALLYPKSTNH